MIRPFTKSIAAILPQVIKSAPKSGSGNLAIPITPLFITASAFNLSYTRCRRAMMETDHDTKWLLPKELISEYELSPSRSLHAWRRTSLNWRQYVGENKLSVAAISVLSVTNIITIFLLLLFHASKQLNLLSVNQPPNGVPSTFAHLVRIPTPTFIHVSWYPPENSFFRKHNSAEADKLWKWYDASGKSRSAPLLSSAPHCFH